MHFGCDISAKPECWKIAKIYFLAGSFRCFEIEIKEVLLFIYKGDGEWRNKYYFHRL